MDTLPHSFYASPLAGVLTPFRRGPHLDYARCSNVRQGVACLGRRLVLRPGTGLPYAVFYVDITIIALCHLSVKSMMRGVQDILYTL